MNDVGNPARFFCDEMLMRLGRWLRAAGYDTRIAADGEPDRDILQRAHKEHRLLLTRDRKLLEHRRADGTVVLLRGNDLDEQVRELSQRLPIDWHYRPLSRCLVCNTQLADGAASNAEVPADVDHSNLRHCPACGRVYWEGSHARRMRRQLESWQINHRF